MKKIILLIIISLLAISCRKEDDTPTSITGTWTFNKMSMSSANNTGYINSTETYNAGSTFVFNADNTFKSTIAGGKGSIESGGTTNNYTVQSSTTSGNYTYSNADKKITFTSGSQSADWAVEELTSNSLKIIFKNTQGSSSMWMRYELSK